jgi:hypothetical protein
MIAGPSTARASLIAFFSSSGLRAAKPEPPQARECSEIRIGKVNALHVGRHSDRLSLQPDQAKRGVVIDDNLDRQLVLDRREELAHQHVEAAVAGQRDDLTRPIERLDAVGLTKGRPHGAVFERPDDALRSALPDPVGGP